MTATFAASYHRRDRGGKRLLVLRRPRTVLRVEVEQEVGLLGFCSPQNDAQIGHSVSANGAAINLECPQHTNETGIDLLFTPFRKQHP